MDHLRDWRITAWNYTYETVRDRRMLGMTNRLLRATKGNNRAIAEMPDHRFVYREDMPPHTDEIRITTVTDVLGRGIVWSSLRFCDEDASHRNGRSFWLRSDGEVFYRYDRYQSLPDLREDAPKGEYRPWKDELQIRRILEPMGVIASYLEQRTPAEEMIAYVDLNLNV